MILQMKGKVWREYENIQLADMAKLKKTITEIATHLGRSEYSCHQKLRTMGFWKHPDGTFSKNRFKGRYESRPRCDEGVPDMDIKDVINCNIDPKAGKVNPLLYARIFLCGRLVIESIDRVYLDNKRQMGLDTIMREANKIIRERGLRQIDYNINWVVC